MSELHQLIYTSTFVPGSRGALSQMRSIVTHARSSNYLNHLTGCLLFDGACFVQILEGHQPDIDACFEKIEHDSRHTRISIIQRRAIPHRQFAVWALAGFVRKPANAGIFRRHRFQTQKRRKRFEGDAMIALGLDLIRHEDEISAPAILMTEYPLPRVSVSGWIATQMERLGEAEQ